MMTTTNEEQARTVDPKEILAPMSAERAMVDIQVSTAKAYPRDLALFERNIESMALANEDNAKACYYALPRDGRIIDGPGVRLAEIAVHNWGNIRAEKKAIETDGMHVTGQATVWDMESNVAIRAEVKRRIVKRDGTRYSEDMITTTANAAMSIALRNAVFAVIPFFYIRPVFEKCKMLAAGDIKSLAQSRTDAFDYFKRWGVVDEQILAALSRKRIEDVDLGDVGTLRGLVTAINEKVTTIDEAFPPTKSGKMKSGTDSQTGALKSRLDEAKNGDKEPEGETEQGEAEGSEA